MASPRSAASPLVANGTVYLLGSVAANAVAGTATFAVSQLGTDGFVGANISSASFAGMNTAQAIANWIAISDRPLDMRRVCLTRRHTCGNHEGPAGRRDSGPQGPHCH